MKQSNHDPLQPHSHDPNPTPPTADPGLRLTLPDGTTIPISVAELQALPATTVSNCFIVSTGHGTSGPFSFTGVKLLELLEKYIAVEWSHVEVVSADGFGSRIGAEELHHPAPSEPILLAYAIDGKPMTRQQGLVRLIVPSEKDDALRQVKWVEKVTVCL